MANVFKATADIVQEMCDDYQNITGIVLSPQQIDDERVVKMWTYAGAISSMYAQAQRVSNDIFSVSASLAALLAQLQARGLPTQGQPTKSQGQLSFTTTDSASFTVGLQAKRVSDGAIFQCIQAVSVVGAGTLTAYFESIGTGNAQNLDSTGNPFTLVTPVANVNQSGTNASLFLNGTDLESNASMIARIQAHDQSENSGGNVAAYKAWALAASSEVVTATVIPLARGPDTVDVYITSGTTDITTAVNSGGPVTRLPSAGLISLVQAYIQALNPITDNVLVKAPTETPFNVTVRFALYTEDTSTRSYVASQILNIVKIYLYSAAAGSTINPTALERLIDQGVGSYISERSVDSFNGMTSTYYTIPTGQILTPGTITTTTLN